MVGLSFDKHAQLQSTQWHAAMGMHQNKILRQHNATCLKCMHHMSICAMMCHHYKSNHLKAAEGSAHGQLQPTDRPKCIVEAVSWLQLWDLSVKPACWKNGQHVWILLWWNVRNLKTSHHPNHHHQKTGWAQHGLRMGSGWAQDGLKMGSGWAQDGLMMAHHELKAQDGLMMGSGCNQDGIRMGSIWAHFHTCPHHFSNNTLTFSAVLTPKNFSSPFQRL